jgi:UDP-N-acetylglucosamine diphosphorylase/glucosamine-1-phosphate N-acetyltransferase
MHVYIYEDRKVCNLEPLTLTRPAFELWCGASTLLHKQLHYFGATSATLLVRTQLTELCRLGHPRAAVNTLEGAGRRVEPAIMINARWLAPAPTTPMPRAPALGVVDNQLAYALLPAFPETLMTSGRQLSDWLAVNRSRLPVYQAGGKMIEHPWDLVEKNASTLQTDFVQLAGKRESRVGWPGLFTIGPRERLLIDPTAIIEPLVTIDVSHGPVIIDGGALVRSFSRIQGPCYIGRDTQVRGASVCDSTIGPMCRIGGEIEESIIQGFSNKCHDGFLGHSYVGSWVNLGAGTQVSDLRNDYGSIPVTINRLDIDTGLNKVGVFMGDHTKTSIHTSINSGTTVGAFCQLLVSGCLLPKSIPSFHRFGLGRLKFRTDVGRMLDTARIVMERRKQSWTEAHCAYFTALHGAFNTASVPAVPAVPAAIDRLAAVAVSQPSV